MKTYLGLDESPLGSVYPDTHIGLSSEEHNRFHQNLSAMSECCNWVDLRFLVVNVPQLM